jgi:Terpene cyclase DEP1
MNTRLFYLSLAFLGLVIPNSAFWPWLVANGFDPHLFVRDLFANGVSVFFGLDVVLSALALSGFVLIEGKRIGLHHRWVPIVATCLIGVSLGLPLFLYQRQVHMDRANQDVSRQKLE